MTKNDIIVRLYNDNAVQKYANKQLRNFTKENREELISEMYARICELPEDLLLNLYNQGWKHLTAYIRTYCIYSLSPTGETRDLQKMLTIEIPTEFEDESYDDENN